MDANELNDRLTQLYSSAEAASSEGLADEAIKKCEAALELLDNNFDEECKYTPSDFLMIAGHACWEDGDLEGALRYYRQASDSDPERMDAAVALGVALFHLGRFVSAQQCFELVTVEDPEIAEAWHYMGLLALRARKVPLAEIFFARAHEREPQRWLKPTFLDPSKIEEILNEIFGELPKDIQRALKDVAVILDDQVPEELIHSSSPPLDPLALGLFDGIPLPEQGSEGAPTDVNRILIFSDNIALMAADEAKLREELAITLKHEIGHYLGLDEDDLAARGLD